MTEVNARNMLHSALRTARLALNALVDMGQGSSTLFESTEKEVSGYWYQGTTWYIGLYMITIARKTDIKFPGE